MTCHPKCVLVYIVRIKTGRAEHLLLRRCGDYLQGTWQMVTGRIEPAEPAWQAGLREMEEETGLIPERFYSADAIESFYLPQTNEIVFAPAFVAFVSPDADVRLSPTEHDAYEWLPLEEALPKLAFQGQVRIMKAIDAHFIQMHPSHILQIPLPSTSKS